MIVTLTPNPSVDMTLMMDSAVVPGGVHRTKDIQRVAGGKGINVSHALHLAQATTLALCPAQNGDPFLNLLLKAGIPFAHIPLEEAVRINTTITQPDGLTTKFNGPGAVIDDATKAEMESLLIRNAQDAQWVVMAGSLPPGLPQGWYSEMIAKLRRESAQTKIAVDTSGEAMKMLADGSQPDLLKPNAKELGQLTGLDGDGIEAAANEGNYWPVIRAAELLRTRGISEVLVTLGPAGAVLFDDYGRWLAVPPPVQVRSTVGAGDAALAGYLLADQRGLSSPEKLRHAVAYGSAAAGLPGTLFPKPADVDLAATEITDLCGLSRP